MSAPSAEELLAAEGLRASPWSNGPGDRYAAHAHDYDKVLVAERGSIAFILDGQRRLELATGDRLDLPAGTGHAAEVGPDGVRCLEAHLPAGTLGGEARRIVRWVAALDAPPETGHDGVA